MDTGTKFHIEVANFAGPLDLLLQLIERHKLHISEVSLAKVADEYLAYLQSFDNRPKRDMADFIIIASTLMLIKSFSLLPTLIKTEEEESDIEELKRRLALYQEFQQIAAKLKTIFGQQPIFFPDYRRQRESIFAPTEDLSLANLHQAIARLITELPKPEVIPEAVVKKVISLETVIENLTQRIQRSMKMNFSDFVDTNQADRMEVIVSFLGLLELAKQGIVKVEQTAHFSDIALESEAVDTPRY